MSNSILTNLSSLSICNDLKFANSILSRTLERMSSGLSINQAKDNTSGCVISDKVKVQLNGTYQAQKNLQSGVSMLNVAQGAYQNMSNILLRLRDISLRAMDDSYDKTSRQAFMDEANELTNQLEQIRTSTEYNGISLFNNSNVVGEASTTNLASPAVTNFSMQANLMPKALSIEDDSGGEIFEYGLDDNKTANNDDKKQEVSNNDLALSCLEEENSTTNEVPMMMSTRAISVTPIEKTTVSFAANETKTINIGNNSYEVKNTQNKVLDFKYQQDSTGKITFSGGDHFAITALNDEVNNVVINSYGTKIYLRSANDIIEVRGAASYVVSQGGSNEVKISAEQTRIILNGNGNDTIYSSSSYNNQYIYLGEGDDNIQNLKINNSVITKKSGNTLYNLANLKDCTCFNIEKIDSDLKLVENAKQASTITINNKQYTVEVRESISMGQHLFYKYDEEKERIVFAGYNSKIQSLNSVGEKNLLYGNNNSLYGTSENDDILIGVGSFNNNAYGKSGDDLLVTEEFYTSYSNYLYGENGNDTLIGNSKTGYWGEAGNDTIIVNTQASSSGATGGAGNDTFEINGKTEIYDTSGDNTFYINVDNITADVGGSSAKFVINGNNNVITGSDGDDIFEINGDNNKINGGSGDDYYTDNSLSSNIENALDITTNGKMIFNSQSEEQSFTVNGKVYSITNKSNTTNTLYWNYSNGEVLITGSNFDIIANDNTEHNIVIDGSNNIIEGGNKNDIITIKNGENNFVLGNRGDDKINLDYKNNSADGGIGNDKININATTNLSVNGNVGNDVINFNANNITNLQAGDGDDKIVGITSNSVINLGNGNNEVELIGNNNKITGGSNKNKIEINGNSNNIQTNGETQLDIEGDLNYYIATAGVISGKINGDQNNIDIKDANNSIIRLEGDENSFQGSSGVDEITIVGSKNITYGNNGNDNFNLNEGDSNEVDGGLGRNVLYNEGTNTNVRNMINITPKPLDINLHIGADDGAQEVISTRLLFTIGDFELNFETSEKAAENLGKIDKLLNQIDEQMSSIGSALNRLDSIYELQNKEIENLSITKSLITDTDIAAEVGKLANAKILQEVSTSLFAQANQIGGNLALKLLTGSVLI